MDKKFAKKAIGWGFVLWLFGYVLGIVFFMIVPPEMLGWVITPFGLAFILWILFKKIGKMEMKYYLKMAATWTVMAMLLDYLFIVKLFNSTDYYKLDIYVYYTFTFTLPLLVGWYKNKKVTLGKK